MILNNPCALHIVMVRTVWCFAAHHFIFCCAPFGVLLRTKVRFGAHQGNLSSPFMNPTACISSSITHRILQSPLAKIFCKFRTRTEKYDTIHNIVKWVERALNSTEVYKI